MQLEKSQNEKIELNDRLHQELQNSKNSAEEFNQSLTSMRGEITGINMHYQQTKNKEKEEWM